MIRTVIFDLGGVIMTIDQQQAVRRFKEIGVNDAEHLLDPYTQAGIFGALEEGLISDEEFRQQLSDHIGHELTWQQCAYAWQGYCLDVPSRNLEYLLDLRRRGFRVLLLSNTNPFMMAFARSDRFSGDGHALDYYFDRLYLSYEHRMMKPSELFFRHVLTEERTLPEDCLFVDDGPRNCAAASQLGYHAICPENGSDWRALVEKELAKTDRASF